MNANEARRITGDARDQIRATWEVEHKKYMAEEKKKNDELWERRSPVLIEKIEGYIRKAAAKGDSHIWEPNSANPNGSEILYIGSGDFPIQSRLMQHFRDQGFAVQEYLYGGMKITW